MQAEQIRKSCQFFWNLDENMPSTYGAPGTSDREEYPEAKTESN